MIENRVVRLFGVVVAAALAVTAVVQGVMLRRLSRRLENTTQAAEHDEPPRPVTASPPVLRLRMAPPQLAPSVVGASRPPGAALLHEALSTPEGREQLKATLASLKEEKRQQKLIGRVEKREQKDQRWRDKVLAMRSLTPAEAQKLTALFARLREDRQRVLESMKAGHLSSEEADDTTDDLARAHKKEVRALLGEQRWKEVKEEERRLRPGKDLATADPPAPSE
jgi:hypothetical protein